MMAPIVPTTTRKRNKLGIVLSRPQSLSLFAYWRHYDLHPTTIQSRRRKRRFQPVFTPATAAGAPMPPRSFDSGLFGRVAKMGEAHSLNEIKSALGQKSIVMVGLMGCGKSAVGRRLAAKLGLPFVDADEEIEKAAGKSIEDIFAEHGEPYFRRGRAQSAGPALALGPASLGDGRRGLYECRDARKPSGSPASRFGSRPTLSSWCGASPSATTDRCSRPATPRS